MRAVWIGRIAFALASCQLGAALASPRSDPTTGRAVFTGAAHAHPTSLVLNPATLGVDAAVGLRTAYVASTLLVEDESIDRLVEDEAGVLSAGPTVSDLRGSPGAETTISWHPAQRISVGAGLRSPPAETFFSGGAPYHSLGGEQRDLALTFASAFQVSSLFHIGAALSLSRTRLQLRFARDTALEGGTAGLDASCGDARCGLGNPAAAELYDVEVGPASVFSSDNLELSLALSLGFVVKLGTDTYLGVSYHTPPGFSIQTSLVGRASVRRAPRDGGETVTGSAAVDVAYPANVEAGFRAPLWSQLQLVLGVRWEDTSRLSGYDVRPHGRELAAAQIPIWIRRARGLSDAVAMWGGVEQVDRGEPWRFGARVGYELATVDDRDVSPGGNSTRSATVDLGAQWRPGSASWALQVSYGLAYFLPLSVQRSAYSPRNLIACVDSGYDYASAACAAARDGYGIESAAGSYRHLQHALRLGLRYEF